MWNRCTNDMLSCFYNVLENLTPHVASLRSHLTFTRDFSRQNHFQRKKSSRKMSQIKFGANFYDQIIPSLIKTSAPYVINSVVCIFSGIINSCQFPKVWKNVHVLPHHRNGSKLEIKIYRPITMLCANSIVFE